jgi:RNA polymerase sigma factor (sigma-70 family)
MHTSGVRVELKPDPLIAQAVADFERVRSRLFGVAYQVLGRAADAEDVVQDVWIRWQGADRTVVRDRVAFLTTATRRVALNEVTSARVRREVSDGVAPSHERDPAAADPALESERAEELGRAVQLLLERLAPVERAVYVLREAFDYSFRDIGDLLGLSEANARQVARRARLHLAGRRTAQPVHPEQRRDLLEAFVGAARTGDLRRLIEMLGGAAVPAHRAQARA